MRVFPLLGATIVTLFVGMGASAIAQENSQENAQKPEPIASEVPVGLVTIVVGGSLLVVGCMAVFGNKQDERIAEKLPEFGSESDTPDNAETADAEAPEPSLSEASDPEETAPEETAPDPSDPEKTAPDEANSDPSPSQPES